MGESQHEVKREVTLPADREEVWQALTEPVLVEQWLAEEVEIDLREGGEIRLRYEGGEERRGTVEEVIEEERLRIRWRRESRPETHVDFVLADAGAGTRLVVVESVRAPVGLVSTGGWDARLFTLEVFMLGRGAALLRA